MADSRLTLVYDGDCDLCRGLARWVERRDQHGRVSVRANQEAGLTEQLGLTRGEADRAAWAVKPGGARFEGAAAINRVLRELGGAWSMLALLYMVPPIRWTEDAYYGRVARKRSWF